MQLESKPFASLDATEHSHWRSLFLNSDTLWNPFLHPAFAAVADRVWGEVQVLSLCDENDRRGFFAFQQDRWGNARPLAEGLNEHQAVVCDEGLNWSGRELLKAAGLRSLRFDHLNGEQAERMGGWISRSGGSPYADLSQGFEHYLEQRKRAGSSTLKETARKHRKLEREVGATQFVWDDRSDEAFESLIEWKQQQHVRTGVVDLFARNDIVDFLNQVRSIDEREMKAHLSSLRVDGQLCAVHLGLYSQSVGHLWYPAYCDTFSRFSPGMILFLAMMEQMAENGVQLFDFGPGPQRYKQSLRSSDLPVCIGVVDRNGAKVVVRKAATQAKKSLKRALELPGRLAALASGVVPKSSSLSTEGEQ